jgi:hypothetical protein
VIFLYHPGLPPSANNAYVNLPHGGRRLSKEGEKYKNETLAFFTRTYRKELLTFKKNTPYLVAMTFFFDAVETKGWASGKAESRYKKFDATNRPKLLEDVLKDAAGIDDSQNLDVYLRKRDVAQCPHNIRWKEATIAHAPNRHGEEHVDIMIWDLEKEANPFDAAFRSHT